MTFAVLRRLRPESRRAKRETNCRCLFESEVQGNCAMGRIRSGPDGWRAGAARLQARSRDIGKGEVAMVRSNPWRGDRKSRDTMATVTGGGGRGCGSANRSGNANANTGAPPGTSRPRAPRWSRSRASKTAARSISISRTWATSQGMSHAFSTTDSRSCSILTRTIKDRLFDEIRELREAIELEEA